MSTTTATARASAPENPPSTHRDDFASRAILSACGPAGPVVALPSDFDPRRFPILAAHYFGHPLPVEPSAEVVDLRLVHLARALHRLGDTIDVNAGGRAEMLRRVVGS